MQKLYLQCSVIVFVLFSTNFIFCESYEKNSTAIPWKSTDSNDDIQSHLAANSLLMDILNNTHSFPSLLNHSSNDIHARCFEDLQEILYGLLHKKKWALKFVDAAGKPPSALLGGALRWLGSYSECKQIHATYEYDNQSRSINGQYCTIMASSNASSLKKVQLSVGICIPESCSKINFTEVLGVIKDILPEPIKSIFMKVDFSNGAVCLSDEIHWDGRGKVGLFICSLFGLLMLCGTAIEVYRMYSSRNKRQFDCLLDSDVKSVENVGSVNIGFVDNEVSVNNARHAYAVQEPEISVLPTKDAKETSRSIENQPGLIVRILLCFSMYSNGKKIFNTDSSDGTLSCIHGIRFFSMTWVILGHTYYLPAIMKIFQNYVNLEQALNELSFQTIISGGPYSVDSFFLISGTLLSYLFIRQVEKVGGPKKINWFQFYFHRIWRLTPAYMLILALDVCLFRYFGSGPLWSKTGFERDYCSNTWWTNLLYVNNFVKTKEMCMGWSWYLANDMQFYVLSPIYLIPLSLLPLIGITIVSVLALASWGVSFFIINHYELYKLDTNLALGNPEVQSHYFNDFYVKPYCRIAPYLIGIILGYALAKTKCKVKMNWIVCTVGWMVATAVNLSVVYGRYHVKISDTAATFDMILSKSAWSLGLAWVIFACVNGYGGIVNSLLSWKAIIPLSRLTYCVYLVHMLIIAYFITTRETLIELSHQVLVPYFLGFLVTTFGIAFLLSLAFEAPLIALEKIFYNRKGR